MVLTGLALLLVIITLPFSLCTCIKVVAEYERSVIFRLGRLRKGKLHKIEGSHSWTKPPGGGTVCRRGCSGVAAELAELALVNQVDDVTTDQLMTTPYRNNLDNLESKIFLCQTGGAKGPGIFFIIPCTDSYQKVDLRTVSFDVPPQEVLSRDSVTVSVDAVVYYRVSNPTMATNNIEDYRSA